MQKQDQPVAFFDSGLGGISVLRETVRLLPQENYLYYGDSLHAPYGVKSEAQIQALSLAAAEHLVSAGAKAIVVACNTATSAAIGLLRQTYPDIPVIGTEPALKPAVEKYPGGRILVMATPMTIRQEKFQALKRQFDDQAQIIGLPCEGLMEFVERGELRGSAVEAYLAEKLARAGRWDRAGLHTLSVPDGCDSQDRRTRAGDHGRKPRRRNAACAKACRKRHAAQQRRTGNGCF